MSQNVEYVFGIGAELARDFFRRLAGEAGDFFHARLQLEDTRRRFFPRFHEVRSVIGQRTFWREKHGEIALI